MVLSRRQFIVGTVGAGALASAVVEGCNSDKIVRGDEPGPLPVDSDVFTHGVASGDPYQDSVLLWTRAISKDKKPLEVHWLLAFDPDLRLVVASGSTMATADTDWCVKVIADKLHAGNTFYYAFYTEDVRSFVGRTRTLPADTDHIRLAYSSCANFGNGYFHAYRNIAQRRDLDVWVALGDYIYEYGVDYYYDPKLARPLDPKTETLTLEDYRRRHACVRSDLDLQECHRQHPLIVVWDDHEVADNAYKDGAFNHQPNEGDYQVRKRAGIQAFLEWLPIRVENSTSTPKIYREFAFGTLFDLIMLDTRLIGRDKQAGTDDGESDKGTMAEWTDPKRTILGAEQTKWFLKGLSDSKKRGATWRMIGNQVMFSHATDPRDNSILFSDMWDGYQASQSAVLNHIIDDKIDNVVFLTGDIHTSWAFDVAVDPYTAATYDPDTGKGAIAVEFVGPAVTSPGLEGTTFENSGVLALNVNPHLKFVEVTKKGYVLVDIKPEQVQAEWYFVKNIKDKMDHTESLAKSFTVASKKPHLVEAKTASAPKENPPPFAPEG